ncbi:MAG: hypothetical protein K0S12_1144 [Bacteroidetes bacterium]|jgi:hypothetical protein|nr:hypothetical protein [Bacteroidota bacterium]
MESAQLHRIEIKPSVSQVIKAGLAFQGFLILLLGLAGLGFTVYLLMEMPPVGIFTFLATILYLVLAKRYLGKVFYKEFILVSRDRIVIIHKTWWEEKKHEFDIKDVLFFSFAGYFEYTKHPLDNKIVDFTGLGVGERELQFIIDEGTLEIETAEKVIRFGKEVPSWDAEEIIKEAETHAGVKFNNKYPETDHKDRIEDAVE